MIKRQRHWGTELTTTWNYFWQAIKSGFEGPSASWPQETRPNAFDHTSSGMASTVIVTVPDSTATTTATVYSTRFVTVPMPSITSESTATFSFLPPSQSGQIFSNSSVSASTTIPNSTTSSVTVQTFLPPLVPVGSLTTTLVSTTSHTTPTGAATAIGNSTSGSMIGDQSLDHTQKKAIVGGLSGSIAGLLFIAFLIFLILRRRREKQIKEVSDSMSESEKGCRPAFLRTWTALTAGSKGSLQHKNVTEITVSPAVDEEHRIIRMNTRHWPRPFAPGAGEGYRESAPPGQLRVMNPDLSRPVTPRRTSESPAAFLKRQRSGLTGFVFGAYRFPPPTNYHQHISRPIAQHETPTITVIDPNLSRDCVAPPYTRTPSWSSYPSVTSSPSNIARQTPENPFRRSQGPPPDSSERPGVPRRPSVASTGGSSWSHLLHPFRGTPRANIPEAHMRSEYSMYSSAGSRRSDPFDLDFRSAYDNQSQHLRRSQAPNWRMYEGT